MPEAASDASRPLNRSGIGLRGESAVQLTQMTIEQRVIIRVPMVRPGRPAENAPDRFARPVPPEAAPVTWVEHKGPKCIDIGDLRAAAITSSRGIDLMLRNHRRLRAVIGRECRSADLYSGFYIQPNQDGALCARRDRILARSGADCKITEIRTLVPEPVE